MKRILILLLVVVMLAGTVAGSLLSMGNGSVQQQQVETPDPEVTKSSRVFEDTYIEGQVVMLFQDTNIVLVQKNELSDWNEIEKSIETYAIQFSTIDTSALVTGDTVSFTLNGECLIETVTYPSNDSVAVVINAVEESIVDFTKKVMLDEGEATVEVIEEEIIDENTDTVDETTEEDPSK